MNWFWIVLIVASVGGLGALFYTMYRTIQLEDMQFKLYVAERLGTEPEFTKYQWKLWRKL